MAARTTQFHDALEGSREFLQSMRVKALWHDFRLAPGWSDEWITGYVGTCMHEAFGPSPELVESWQTLLERSQVRPAGWGFNAVVPQDADSTAWVLNLGNRVGGGREEVALRAESSLDAFEHASGMFGTYGPTEAIRRFIGAAADRSFTGWTSPHACVTAAVAALPGRVADHTLVSAQADDGHWSSYWWESDSFATALACLAITDVASLSRAAQWAEAELRSMDDSPNAFISANLLLVAVRGGLADQSCSARVVSTLCETQLSDGSWSPGARMRVPDPSDPHPDQRQDWTESGRIEGAVVTDLRRLFTTATAIRALSLWDRSALR